MELFRRMRKLRNGRWIMAVSQIRAARGLEKADLVLKNGRIVNVFTEALEQADVAVCGGRIVGIGNYEGKQEIDCQGAFIAPGFLDGHIHLESSMMDPAEFARTVLPHGTTGVVADPHEIANVCGRDGIDYILRSTAGLPVDVYLSLSSCVPAAPLDESGACLEAEDLQFYYSDPRVVALAEMMNYVGTLTEEPEVMAKIRNAREAGRVVDGHAPGLRGYDLCGYLTAGVQSDHECTSEEEAKERIARGQWLMIREGTAAKNLEALIGMFSLPYCEHSMLVTDDKHPGDLLHDGHMDGILRKAVALGADPCIAVKMASYNTARYFGLKELGAVAPGYRADLVVLEDLESFRVRQVIKGGQEIYGPSRKLVVENGTVNKKLKESVRHSFHIKKLERSDFYLPVDPQKQPKKMRVIQLQRGQILTREKILDYVPRNNGISLEQDVLKLAVLERHMATGHRGIGYIQGYGLKKGAIASSVAHDSHNLIVAGTNEQDMAAAANEIRRLQGGWAIAVDGRVLASLALPIGGLMSELPVCELAEQIDDMKEKARKLGVDDGIDPFMTLAFLSLPVIPEIKLTTYGLVDVRQQKVIPVLL